MERKESYSGKLVLPCFNLLFGGGVEWLCFENSQLHHLFTITNPLKLVAFRIKCSVLCRAGLRWDNIVCVVHTADRAESLMDGYLKHCGSPTYFCQ